MWRNLLPRPPRDQHFNALTAYYRCRDDKWIMLTILNENRDWPVLVQCLGRENLIDDPRFVQRADRFKHAHALIAEFDAAFAGTRDRPEWRKEILGDAGLVFEIVASAEDTVNDQQAIDAGVLVPFENDTLMTIDKPLRMELPRSSRARRRTWGSTAARSCAKPATATARSNNFAPTRPWHERGVHSQRSRVPRPRWAATHRGPAAERSSHYPRRNHDSSTAPPRMPRTVAPRLGPTAHAQSYPSKPITMVVPYPPGGGTDATARLMAEKMGKKLGQNVIVDNRSGASGLIGTGAVAKAAPDGYTILVALSASS